MSIMNGPVRLMVGALVAAGWVVVAGAQQGLPSAPKPGPEHDVLKLDAGAWDAKVEIIPGPGAQPMTSSMIETNSLACGGMCLISDVKGEIMPGQPFAGHGMTVWDPAKKAYVGAWADNMMPGMARSETTYDPSAKKHTGWMEMNEGGTPTKTRLTVEYPSATTRTMSSYATGPDGKEFMNMRITYTKRK